MKPNVSPSAARAALVALLVAATAAATSAQTAPTFTVKGPAPLGEIGPQDAVAADFDNDGDLDVLVTTVGLLAPGAPPPAQRINSLVNDGSGLLVKQGTLDVPRAGRVAVADFNGDGRADLAVSVTGGTAQCPTMAGGVAIFLRAVDGTLSLNGCVSGTASPLAIQAADFNSDAIVDLAVSSSSGDRMRLHLGNGAGAFASGVQLPDSGLTVRDMATPADIDGDGRLDIVVGTNTGFKAFLGQGNGTFVPGGNTVPGGQTLAIAVGDVTGDRIVDLVELASGTYRVDSGVGNGSFNIGADRGFAPGMQDIALADMDSDGDLDILIAGGALGVGTRLLLNDGAGAFPAFGSSIAIGGGPNPVRIVGGDFSGDRASDAAFVDGTANAAFVALQQDKIAPTVDITTPADASTVRGMVTISATATDSNGVASVEFLANGNSIGTSTGPNFSVTWDTSALIGNFTITARAVDTVGNAAEDSVSVIVADQVNPTVNITSPLAGSTVSGMLTVSATAADNVGVTRVDFFANGASIGSSNGPSFSVSWDASALAGNVTLRARAFDAAGNAAENTVAVIVADIAAPSVPTNLAGESLRNFHAAALSWTASTDNVGVAFYRVYELVRVSGNNTVWELVADRVTQTSAVVEIRNRRGQAHTFAVAAVDAAGNESARSISADVSRKDSDRDDND